MVYSRCANVQVHRHTHSHPHTQSLSNESFSSFLSSRLRREKFSKKRSGAGQRQTHRGAKRKNSNPGISTHTHTHTLSYSAHRHTPTHTTTHKMWGCERTRLLASASQAAKPNTTPDSFAQPTILFFAFVVFHYFPARYELSLVSCASCERRLRSLQPFYARIDV